MLKKGPRQIVFVCAAVVNGKLASDILEHDTSEMACEAFESKYNVKPESVQGPFYRKRTGFLDSQTDVKFSGKTYKGIFQDWYVTLMELSSPIECVWVFFDTALNNAKGAKPKSIIVKKDAVKIMTMEEIKQHKELNK